MRNVLGALVLAVISVFSCLVLSGAAHAQATRTFVSGVGDDANPCSRTAPCKTFAGAISKTAPAGQIDCLDPGGFGAVTITKAISIVCANGGGYGSVLVAGTNGIVVAAGANDTVILRGLDFDGANKSGLTGILFNSGGNLVIDNCIIHHFNNWGVNLATSNPASVLMTDVKVYYSGSGGTTVGGVQVSPGSSSANLSVEMDRVRVFDNNGAGIKANGVSGTTINMTVRNSIAASNSSNGIVGTSASGGTIKMMIAGSESSRNGAFGVIADGSGTTTLLGDSVVTGNATGVGSSNSGTLQSFKTNQIGNNTSDGTPITGVSLQ